MYVFCYTGIKISIDLFRHRKAWFSLKKFSRIYIEITNNCNLSCSFCAGNARVPRFMTAAEFSALCAQAVPFTDYIYLHVLGEPLLHPQLGDFLAIAQDFSLKVNVTTNGTLLKKQQELLLCAPALRKVGISLHSLETPDEAVRTQYLRDVASFALAATAAGKLCELRLWNLGVDDIDNTDLFTPLCAYLGLDEAARTAAQKEIETTGSITLRPRLFLGKAERFQWPSLHAPLTNCPVFCHALRNHCAILCDGTLVPCCLDSRGDIALGNVFDTPLATLLSTPRAQAIYDGFSNRTPHEELCKRCGYATRF